MAQNKTQPTKMKVSEFIASVEDPQKRKDCREIMKLMREVTGKRATMWGTSIVGFGQYHYKYASGREGENPGQKKGAFRLLFFASGSGFNHRIAR
jgi:nucleoid DNA-binding protein